MLRVVHVQPGKTCCLLANVARSRQNLAGLQLLLPRDSLSEEVHGYLGES